MSHSAKFWYLHRSWFLIVLELHLSETGMVFIASSPSFVRSGLVDLVNPVNSGLTSLHYFGTELGMPSSQPSVRQLAGNALSTCGTGGGSSIGPNPSTEFLHSACSRLLLMDNRSFLWKVWLHPSPYIGCTTYAGKCG